MAFQIQFGPLQLATTLALLWPVYLLLLGAYRIWLDPLSKYPGPRLYAASRLPWLYHFVRGDQPHVLCKLHDIYGEVVRTAPNELSFVTPGAQRDIHSHAKAQYFPKERKHYPQRDRIVRGILTADEVDHTRHRKAWSPAFSERALREQESLFQIYIDALAELLQKNSVDVTGQDAVVNFDRVMNWTTFDIVGHLVFGEAFGCLRDTAFHPWVAMIFDNLKAASFVQAIKFYPFLVPLLQMMIPKSLLRKRQESYDFATAQVAKRIENGSDMPDFLSYVLDHRGKTSLSRLEIEMDSSIMITAGSETAATAMSAVMFYACRNPDVMARLISEIRGTFQHEKDITAVGVGQLKFLNACIEEALRLFPPVPAGLPRRLSNCDGMIIGGRWVPSNTVVSVPQYAGYRWPANFTDPNSFRPERWLGDPRYSSDCREVFQPFGTGPRNCIGKSLGYLEMRLILSRIFFQFDFEMKSAGDEFAPENQEVHYLWDKIPLLVKVHLRNKP